MATVSIYATNWTASWSDGAAASPEETYTVKCVASGGSCTASEEGTTDSDIARGVQQGTVANLSASTEYTCYIISSSPFGTECSSPVDILTEPGAIPAAPSEVTTAPVPGELFQREVSWSIPNAESYQITNYTITCTSTAVLTYEGSSGRVSEILKWVDSGEYKNLMEDEVQSKAA